MRLALVTDAWHPQVNGVVRSLGATVERLRARGWSVAVFEPSMFRAFPCPTYPEIQLAFGCGRELGRLLDRLQPEAIHVATEGPVGWAARGWCLKRGRRYTTSFHTRFPDYVSLRTGLPAAWIWPMMRRFHGPAERTFAVTRSLADELAVRGIHPVHHWPLGVDLAQFHRDVGPDPLMAALPRPIMLNVGRVAVEKNIEAFLDCPIEGSKVVVGEGPALAELMARYPKAYFLGLRHGEALASAYAAADVFVFPSRTDTFGLVNIEALACGVPVAAYPERGPIDILGAEGRGVHGGMERIGALHSDLATAIRAALPADRAAAAFEARHYDWERCTDRFVDGLSLERPAQPMREAA